jgi:two-component system, cell cycle sensor histidine kinase and response regulator CckA
MGNRVAEDFWRSKQYRGDIDLILTDVVMPEFSGRQMQERLRALHPDLPVLFMSGYTDDAVVRHGVLDSKANFIQKPFSSTGLADAVHRVLEERGKGAVARS